MAFLATARARGSESEAAIGGSAARPASRRSAALSSRRAQSCGVVAEPLGEAPAAAREARRDVAGDQRGLDRERAGAAHRVEERPAGSGDLAPARDAENGGGEVLLDGRLDLDAGLAVAALVELGARQVDRDDGLVGAHHHVDEQVGLGGVDVGAAAGEVGEPVGDRVFDAHRGELRVAQRVVDAGRVDRDRAVGADVVLPRQRSDGLVELIGGRARARARA